MGDKSPQNHLIIRDKEARGVIILVLKVCVYVCAHLHSPFTVQVQGGEEYTTDLPHPPPLSLENIHLTLWWWRR